MTDSPLPRTPGSAVAAIVELDGVVSADVRAVTVTTATGRRLPAMLLGQRLFAWLVDGTRAELDGPVTLSVTRADGARTTHARPYLFAPKSTSGTYPPGFDPHVLTGAAAENSRAACTTRFATSREEPPIPARPGDRRREARRAHLRPRGRGRPGRVLRLLGRGAAR